jgi:hypothetical protein
MSLSDRSSQRPNPNAPVANREGADAPKGRRVAWLSRQSKDPGYRWPRDAPTCRCRLAPALLPRVKAELNHQSSDSRPVLSTPRVTCNNLSQDGSQYGSRSSHGKHT